MGEAGQGVLTRFGTASPSKVECLRLGLGLFRVVFSDVARAEAVAALYEAMVFAVAQGARRAVFSIRDVTFLPGGGLEGGKVEMPAVGAVVGLGIGSGGPADFLAADTYVSDSSMMATAVMVQAAHLISIPSRLREVKRELVRANSF